MAVPWLACWARSKLAGSAAGTGGEKSLYPADASLNRRVELHSHRLRRTAAVESCRCSFEEAVAAVGRATGQHVPKR